MSRRETLARLVAAHGEQRRQTSEAAVRAVRDRDTAGRFVPSPHGPPPKVPPSPQVDTSTGGR